MVIYIYIFICIYIYITKSNMYTCVRYGKENIK